MTLTQIQIIFMVAGRYNKPKVENFKKLNLYLAKVEQLKKIQNERLGTRSEK
jgi:hypothetical protein